MHFTLNTLLSILVSAGFLLFLVRSYLKSRGMKEVLVDQDFTSLDKVVEAVKVAMVDILKEDSVVGLTDEEFNALYRRRARISDALRNCVYSVDSAKIIVKELIKEYIASNVPMETINSILGFADGLEPSSQVKFETILYMYGKKYKKNAFTQWVKDYGFDQPKPSLEEGSDEYTMAYYITQDEFDRSYSSCDFHLTNDDRLNILTTIVYEIYKGFGVVDTLRDQNINGLNFGTSGVVLTSLLSPEELKKTPKATRSCWVYLGNAYIHLQFIDFGSEEEIRRLVQLICRYGSPGPLTAKRGYLINTMYDKSRVLALRPPASEYWAVFIRKFSLSSVTPQALLTKDYNHNSVLAINLLNFIMKGETNTCFSGRQGSGKTTMMTSVVRFISTHYNIRVLETVPEMYLRSLYPHRNILSLQETTTCSASELQDALKKSDAAVSFVGEVATDELAAKMVQFAMTGSQMSLFSHHAKTAKDLVLTLRNSLVNAGGFNNMSTAEKQVVEAVKLDVHLDFTPDGRRYIERITEIVPLEEGIDYPEIDDNNVAYSQAVAEREFYTRSTDRISFYTHDILRYDVNTDTYEVADRFSPELESALRSKMSPFYREQYDRFIYENWPRRAGGEVDEVWDAMARYEADPESTFLGNSAFLAKKQAAEERANKLGDLVIEAEDENMDYYNATEDPMPSALKDVSISDLLDANVVDSLHEVNDVELDFDFFTDLEGV